MPKPSIDLPSIVQFVTDIPLRITDINYGGHLGNDSVLALVHEARVQFLKRLGSIEFNPTGIGLIMADAHVEFRSEAFYGATIRAEVSSGDISSRGFQLYTRLLNKETGTEVARIRTGMVCFDYARRHPVKVPDALSKALREATPGPPSTGD